MNIIGRQVIGLTFKNALIFTFIFLLYKYVHVCLRACRLQTSPPFPGDILARGLKRCTNILPLEIFNLSCPREAFPYGRYTLNPKPPIAPCARLCMYSQGRRRYLPVNFIYPQYFKHGQSFVCKKKLWFPLYTLISFLKIAVFNTLDQQF